MKKAWLLVPPVNVVKVIFYVAVALYWYGLRLSQGCL